MKNVKLNAWLWKWHFIAGVISLPFIILLSITGGIYLFNASYQEDAVKPFKRSYSNRNSVKFSITNWN